MKSSSKEMIQNANTSSSEEKKLGLGKINLIMIVISFAIIVAGLLLMGGDPSGETYNADIFSTRRITIGPMISLFGFVMVLVSILVKTKK